MFIIIILQLYNLGIPVVGESIYKIKNKRHVKKVNIFTKPNKIIKIYHIKHIVVSRFV